MVVNGTGLNIGIILDIAFSLGSLIACMVVMFVVKIVEVQVRLITSHLLLSKYLKFGIQQSLIHLLSFHLVTLGKIVPTG